MQVWAGRLSPRSSPALSPEEKFRRLVNAALGTPYYSKPHRAAALLGAGTLHEVGITPLRDVLDTPAQFENPKKHRRRPEFHAPLESKELAVGGVKLALPRGGREIRNQDLPTLDGSGIGMLAAPPPMLRRLCALVEDGSVSLPCLSEAVVALGSVVEGGMLSGERDMLWRCLGVPVFEQWLGLEGELLAWECESHRGMHLNRSSVELEEVGGEWVVTSWEALRIPVLRMATGWRGSIQHGKCICGEDSALLLRGTAVEEMAMAAGAA